MNQLALLNHPIRTVGIVSTTNELVRVQKQLVEIQEQSKKLLSYRKQLINETRSIYGGDFETDEIKVTTQTAKGLIDYKALLKDFPQMEELFEKFRKPKITRTIVELQGGKNG